MYTAEQPSVAPADVPVDVIVLVAPSRSTARDQFLRTIAELKSGGRTAVLVVFPDLVDAETARSLHGLASRVRGASTRRQSCRRSDELLDSLWRQRSHPES